MPSGMAVMPDMHGKVFLALSLHPPLVFLGVAIHSDLASLSLGGERLHLLFVKRLLLQQAPGQSALLRGDHVSDVAYQVKKAGPAAGPAFNGHALDSVFVAPAVPPPGVV
jgi:hypothetical protein